MSKIHSFITNLKAPFHRFTLTTPAAIILAAIILGASHVAYGMISQAGQNQAPTAMFGGKPIDDKDHVEGNQKSNIVVVEYSDPECPYCVALHPTMKQIRNEYENKIAFVYRHFPLTQIHPHAYDESKAIVCAATLGGTKTYYEYIDALFGYKSNHQTTQLPATGKEDLASGIGLDKTAFQNCLKDQATAAVVDASMSDGVAAGVQGTPTSFVLEKTKKGYKVIAVVDGARPYEYIKAAIDQALAE